jgi:hypothetical protein
MAIQVPGTHTGFNITTYKRGAESATYQKMVAIPIVDDYMEKLGTTGTIRKWARGSSSVLSQTGTGASLDTINIIGTPATITAGGNYAAFYWSRNEDAQTDINLRSGGTDQLEQALAEGSDTSMLTAVQSNTQIMSVAAVDGTTWRQAVGRLMTNTNGVAMPGNRIYAIFTTTQYPALANIAEFNNAEIRGDSENPYVKGIWTRGGGVLANFSTVVAQDANGWHNTVFLPEAYVIGWNVKTEVEYQQDELTRRLILFNNFGSGVQHDLRAVAVRTTASQL